jgi:hypothetical protein
MHENVLNSDWLRVVQFFWNTVSKNGIQCKEKKYNIYIGFLIGLEYETITKIANKIQQFPAEVFFSSLEFLRVTA